MDRIISVTTYESSSLPHPFTFFQIHRS